MLLSEELGVFILVLANATASHDIYKQMSAPLKKRFIDFENSLIQNLSKVAADDARVFQQLIETRIDNLQPSQFKTVGDWQLQYNHLRSFRPARNSGKTITALLQNFDVEGFHFNKPFLKDETLWAGQLKSTQLKILYNKFPFADYHGIFVFEPGQCRPQYLLNEHCLEVDSLLQTVNNSPEFGLAYNSLGAYASINHQHWQSFLSQQDYPVESANWKHNGGGNTYPIHVDTFNSILQAWPLINEWQQHNTAFNLLLRKDKVYAIARKRQGQYQHSNWTSGFAWSEVMGNIIVSDSTHYNQLKADQILQEFTLLTLD